jgi:hypothetical protein
MLDETIEAMGRAGGARRVALALAVPAAASASPHWTVEGKAFAGTESLAETVTLEDLGTESVPKFALTLPFGHSAEASCGKLAFKGAKISENSRFGSTQVSLSGCAVVTYPRGAPTNCTGEDGAGGSPGTINLNPVSGKLVEGAEGKIYLVLTPASGSLLTTVRGGNVIGSPCAISGVTSLTGAFALEVHTVTEGSPARSNLGAVASTTVQSAARTEMWWGNDSAWPFGKFQLHLASGQNWGVSL